MSQFDLGPDDYQVKGKSGRWFRRDDRRSLLVGLVTGLVILGLIFLWRDAVTNSAVLVGATALAGVIIGIFFALLTKDIY